MSLFQLLMFQDTVFGHIILVIYLFAILDEKNRKRRFRKLPPLILSPLIAAVLNLGLDVVIPEYGILCYAIDSAVILCMCTLWVMWAWEMSFWPAFSATCMAAVFQVATSAFLQVIRPLIPYDGNHPFLSLQAMCLPMVLVAVLVSGLLLGKVRFGVWFRRLLEDKDNQRRWAMLCFAMESVNMDVWDLTRCLGILVDNAMEAALETAQPWVEIVLLAQAQGVSVRVSNFWNEAADPARFDEAGWSTKGEGRGLGLAGYRKMLEGYHNVVSATGWKDGVFVQELSISG